MINIQTHSLLHILQEGSDCPLKAIRGIHLDNLDAVVLVGDPMSATAARRMEKQKSDLF